MDVAEPLRDRLWVCGRWLLVEIAAAAAISLVVWWLTQLSWLDALASCLVGIGLLSLLSGGMSGGGFVTAGPYGAFFGRRHDAGWNSSAGEMRRAQDLRERLRANLRPRANPTAFWQVIGGCVLIGLGVVVLSIA